MKVTSETITKIQMALKRKKMTQSEMGKRIGMHRSNISHLLKGEIDTIKDDLIDPINELLEIDIGPIITHEGSISSTVIALSNLSAHDPRMAELLEMLAEIAAPRISPFLPQVDTSKLPKIGAEITRIVHEWERHTDPHYSRIATEVLHMLREYYSTK